MAERIGLIMTGAVSLGSFHAGALTEVLYALDHFRREKNRPVELDVITGASAGAMTAGLVAHIVMNNYAERRQNLYRAWVELVTIDRLLTNPPINALLSGKPVEEIGNLCIQPPFDVAGRAAFAPEVLHMVLTVSNLCGVDRKIEPVSGKPFISTFFNDRIEFHLGNQATAGVESVQDAATWDRVRQFAIASGAFPLAFPPSRLARTALEYDPSNLVEAALDLNPFYVDGGTFNNQPIGEAVRLARQSRTAHFGDTRKFIFVNTNENNSIHRSSAALGAEIDKIEQLGKRLAEIVYQQARTSDWLNALLINYQITVRDQFLSAIIAMIKTFTIDDTPGLIAQLGSLAEEIRVGQGEVLAARSSDPDLNSALARVEAKYRNLLDGADLVPNGRKVAVQFLYILDHVAQLDERVKIDLYSITTDRPLAGRQLQAFGGFFKKDYRDYNFRVGRQLAHKELTEILGEQYPRESGPALFQQYDIPPQWVNLPQEGLKQTPAQPREKLRDMVVQRAMDAIDKKDFSSYGWGVGRFLTKQVVSRILTNRLNQELELG